MRRALAAALLWGALLGEVRAQPAPAAPPSAAPAPGAPAAPAAPAPSAPSKPDPAAERIRPKLAVSVTPQSDVAVGDSITLKIEATVPVGVQVSVPEQSLAPLEALARRSRVEAADGAQRFVFELDLIALAPGSATIPALTVRAVADDGTLAEARTEPRTLEVKSLIANEPNAEPKAPSQPVVVMQDDYTLAWIAGGLLAAGLIAAATLFVQRWLAKRPKALPPAPPPRPPWELALQKLAALDGRKSELLASDRAEEFVDGVSDALREYLGKRYGFEGLESTTDEVLATLERIRPHKLSLSGVSLLLEQCDLAKFARMKPDLAQCDDLWNGAVGLIRATTPPPEAPAVAGVKP